MSNRSNTDSMDTGTKKRKKLGLTTKIFIGLIGGLILGVIFNLMDMSGIRFLWKESSM